MINLKDAERNDNITDNEISLPSLDFDQIEENRPSLPNRGKIKRINTQLDVITSASNFEDEFSD